MKKQFFLVFLLLILIFSLRNLRAQDSPDLSENYPILSAFYGVPDGGQKNFNRVNFRYGWTSQDPYVIAIQFTNAGYEDRKLKFAIKDVTTNQTILLDTVHNAYFGTETIKENSDSAIWSGTVNDIKDRFALRVWNSDGDSFDQAPISILSSWKQKPKNTPIHTATSCPTSLTSINTPTTSSTATQTPTMPQNTPASTETVNAATVAAKKLTHTPTPTPTSTFTRTPTSTYTLTFTYTPSATYTPTRSQTPAPVYNCIYTVMGDSYAYGEGASSRENTFAYLTAETLKTWYPGITYEFDGIPGSEPWNWVNATLGHLESFTKKDGLPLGYVLFQTGTSCFFNVNNGDDRCKGASLSQGVTASYVFQRELDKIIGQIYTVNPDVHLVVLGIPDSSGGAGHYAPPDVYEAYRKRLFELKSKYPKMRIADIYTIMKGQAEWFRHEHDDKDHPNDLGQTVIAKSILKEFSYWPYRPHQH
jgi:hypothetical protein